MLIYSGNLDVIVALPLTEAMLQNMDWNGAAEYKKAKRDVWKIHSKDMEVAGYVKRVHDFYQVFSSQESITSCCCVLNEINA